MDLVLVADGGRIWVGISIARMLSLDGTRQSLVESFSRNAPHILSTVLWVYWGVYISDMIPFYLGRLFKKSGASDDLGINEYKALGRTIVQRYGNLIGFVERFSLGVRNPTAFFAGALGIFPECFFAGVCCGGLITLPVQLGIGFLLRERHVFALATVATVVMPYLDEWSALEEDYIHPLSGTTKALTNSLLWLPDSGNVQVNKKEAAEALDSAVKTTDMIVNHMQSFLPKLSYSDGTVCAEEMDTLISELANVNEEGKALVEECGNLLEKTHTLQMQKVRRNTEGKEKYRQMASGKKKIEAIKRASSSTPKKSVSGR
ncbi:SNARE associated Golgi protein [Tanacetum coccineum]|uniref:SNARE associated Golgi protein n=1 Tax=Tanacetum coccineum TaxID=301880 RepID=A0ABQ5D1R6_9ASTR